MSQGAISLFWGMFIRKKQNKSGVISVQVIDKSSSKYRMLKTIGSSARAPEVEQLVRAGKELIKSQTGAQEIDFTDYGHHTKLVWQGIEQIAVHGPTLVLGKIFDEVGFGQIKPDLFRQLVIARLCFPVSKLKTTDYLSKYQFLDIDVQVVYRYLDKLYKDQKELVQRISYEHTLQILDNKIQVVFYDVTTVYFEAQNEDELCKTGFSKDGKHQHLHNGAKRSAMFYTFTGTCKRHGVKPMAWLTEVLHCIADHKVNKLYELFPQNLKLPELKPYNNHPGL